MTVELGSYGGLRQTWTDRQRDVESSRAAIDFADATVWKSQGKTGFGCRHLVYLTLGGDIPMKVLATRDDPFHP